MERPTILMDWEAQYPKDDDFPQTDRSVYHRKRAWKEIYLNMWN